MSNAGYFYHGLPYACSGRGTEPLVVFPGLAFEHTNQLLASRMMYRFLEQDYRVYHIMRRPHPPRGYSLADMASDYADVIRDEFGKAVDIIGVSTGGSIALQFGADHPELVKHLVIHSSAYSLTEHARKLQMDVASKAQVGDWRGAWKLLVTTIYPRTGARALLAKPLVNLSAALLSLRVPKDDSDLVVTVEAEDSFSFKDRLGTITAPTMVAGGIDDYFYTPALFHETASGIPNARLCLYAHMGHPAGGKQFRKDVLEFLHGESQLPALHMESGGNGSEGV